MASVAKSAAVLATVKDKPPALKEEGAAGAVAGGHPKRQDQPAVLDRRSARRPRPRAWCRRRGSGVRRREPVGRPERNAA
jgi:hypothetical protein